MATFSQLVRIMKPVAKAVLTAQPNAPRLGFHITGAPGGGKSSLAWAMGAIMSKELGFDVPVYEIRGPSLADPSFVTGLPDVTGAVTTLKRMNLLPPENVPSILLIDELGATHPQIRNALTQLIYDKKAGEYQLDQRTFIIATGNRATDRAGATKIETHVANRLRHFELETDLAEWQAFVANKGLPSLLVAFLEQRPDLLHKFDPKSDELGFPSPRTWEEVGIDMLLMNDPKDIMLSAASLVGAGPAVELQAFVERAQALPDWVTFRGMAADDAAALLKKAEASVMYAAIAMAAANCKDGADVEWGINLLDRESPENAVAFIRMLTTVYKKPALVASTPRALKFVKERGVELMS